MYVASFCGPFPSFLCWFTFFVFHLCIQLFQVCIFVLYISFFLYLGHNIFRISSFFARYLCLCMALFRTLYSSILLFYFYSCNSEYLFLFFLLRYGSTIYNIYLYTVRVMYMCLICEHELDFRRPGITTHTHRGDHNRTVLLQHEQHLVRTYCTTCRLDIIVNIIFKLTTYIRRTAALNKLLLLSLLLTLAHPNSTLGLGLQVWLE